MIAIKNKKILVTGASGFIGTPLCRRLIQQKAVVYGVCRKRRGDLDPDVFWSHGDISDLTFVQKLMKSLQPDFIYHLASHVIGHRELHAVQPTFKANLQAAVNLLIVASEIGCERIILIGSQEEPDYEETSIVVPSSPYAAAKWAASSYARMCNALFQTPVTIAKVFMVYGPGQKDLRKLVPYTILSLLNGKSPGLSSGARKVDWIYVDDVVDGLLEIAKSNRLNGKTVDLGTGELVTVRELVEMISDFVQGEVQPKFGEVSERPMEQVRKARSEETKSLIGWQARTSLRDGLLSTIEWYRKHPEG
jgi:nucleoside-diphosphate-sugar epimerase